uniref:Uncharacterized protein n=1 Tax=Podoviridae sp. ctG4L18 TaxID=2825234 RepID=A0A8S5UPK7_9CAUD|nr:MAG TPA: hypothetical protein [Podoviridae sp. ctG4L18]
MSLIASISAVLPFIPKSYDLCVGSIIPSGCSG